MLRSIDVLAPIAASLAQLPWHIAAIEAHLRIRLPRAMGRSVKPLASRLIRHFPKATAPDAKTIAQMLQSLPVAKTIAAHARKAAPPAPLLQSPRFQPSGFALPPLDTPADLADWLAISPEMLTRFADPIGLSALHAGHFGQHYSQILIPKSNGSLRLIEAPKPFLKTLQRRLLRDLLALVPPHHAAFGFRRGRNCIDAAARHCAEPLLMRFDLADFFPSVPFSRVHSIFRALGYPTSTARALACLCTTLTPPQILRSPRLAASDPLRNRHLPQGAPTSPALANLAAWHLDHRLSGLARSLGAQYSRYADDLAFSGEARIGKILARAVPEIVAACGFRVNAAKTRAMPASDQQRVTGVIVNHHVNAPRAEFDRLRAVIHHLSQPADPRRHDLAFLRRTEGQIAWIAQINPARGAKLQAGFASAMMAHRPL